MSLRKLKRSFFESLMAFQADILSLLPGVLFASSLPLLKSRPILVVLYPIFLSVRGALGGMLCGKLSTALNVGWVEPRFRRNTLYFWALLATQPPLSALVAFAFTLIAAGLGGEPISLLFFTSSFALLTSLILPPLTSLVAFSAFNAGLNPDLVLYPIMSSAADLLVTLFFLMLADCLIAGLLALLQALFTLLLVVTLASTIAFGREKTFRSTVIEGVLSLALVSLVVTFTGLGFSRLTDAAPRAVMASYAALADLLGDAAGAFGSLITTRLAIGGLKSVRMDRSEMTGEILGVALAYLLMTLVFAVSGALAMGADPLSALLVVLRAAPIALALSMSASFTMAVVAFKLGLDPDVYVIPLESCLSDLLIAYSLLIASLL